MKTLLNKKVSNSLIEIIFNIYKIIFIFLLLNTIYVLYRDLIQNFSNWTMSDWLINYYDGGFKRRGLMGTLFIFLSDSSSISLKWIVFLFQTIITTILFYFIYKGLTKKK